jgi:hypothetical protein
LRLNPHPARFHVRHADLYESCVRRILRDNPYADEALQLLEWSLERVPYSEGERLAEPYPDRPIYFTVTPATPRYPALRVLYEIVDPPVYCWHVAEWEP